MSEATELKATGIVDWKNRSNLQLGKTDLFDRVINLRLICGNTASEQSEFILRSDYETYIEDYIGSRMANVPVASASRKAIIRRCLFKPSIKVQYKQVSGNTAIEIDIFIQNFFVLSSDGRTLMQFSQSDFPLSCVEVQMGYFGQWNEVYSKQKNGVPTAKQYFSMEAPDNDIQTLFCNVQYVQTEKLPPDYTLHIHGYVGSCYNESVKEMLKKMSGETSTTEDYEVVLYNKSNVDSFKSFQHYLFNNVTRRFLRKTVSFTDKGEQKSLIKSVATDKNGLMDYETAKQYGVRVFISEGIQKHYKFNGKEVIYDGEGNKKGQSSYFSMALGGKTPMSCLNEFATRLPQEIRVFPCDNGDYMLCTKEEAESPDNLGLEKAKWYVYDRDSTGVESDSDGNSMNYKEMGLEMYTFAELSTYIHASMKSIGVPTKATLQNLTEKKAREKSFVRKKLPAVYNITSDALTTIVCPFFWFLNPFESIMFRSRYALGGVTGYYADYTAKDQYFMMLWQSISFATVENVNDVQMVCTTIKGEG